MFLSTKSLIAGVSQSPTLAPNTDKKSPTNPTPHPRSRTDLP